MRNFAVLLIITTLLCLYLGRRSYLQMNDAMDAKKMHEKMAKDRFWETQTSFEE